MMISNHQGPRSYRFMKKTEFKNLMQQFLKIIKKNSCTDNLIPNYCVGFIFKKKHIIDNFAEYLESCLNPAGPTSRIIYSESPSLQLRRYSSYPRLSLSFINSAAKATYTGYKLKKNSWCHLCDAAMQYLSSQILRQGDLAKQLS